MPSQRRTLEFYTALRLLQPSWAGTLLLGLGLDETGRALALASLAAGAAALFLDSDPVNLRTAQREGCTTFTVITLDEALRALKNQLRQGRAIAVALSGDSLAWLQEIEERGVQPKYVAACHVAQEKELRSIKMLNLANILDVHSSSCTFITEYVEKVRAKGWHLIEDEAPTLTERRARDATLLAETVGACPVANLTRQWLRSVPTLFPRALHRAVWIREHVADASSHMGDAA